MTTICSIDRFSYSNHLALPHMQCLIPLAHFLYEMRGVSPILNVLDPPPLRRPGHNFIENCVCKSLMLLLLLLSSTMMWYECEMSKNDM